MITRPFAILMLYFAGLGLLLSGYLSYYTLFVPTGCGQALLTCGTDPVKIAGVPQCVLGFFMFLAAGIVALLLLDGQRTHRWLHVQFWLAGVGTIFAASLSTYELWFQTPAPLTMPSCVYGFFLYLGIWLTTVLARRSMPASA